MRFRKATSREKKGVSAERKNGVAIRKRRKFEKRGAETSQTPRVAKRREEMMRVKRGVIHFGFQI